MDLTALKRFSSEGYVYLGHAKDLGYTGIPTEEQQRQADARRRQRRRAVQETDW